MFRIRSSSLLLVAASLLTACSQYDSAVEETAVVDNYEADLAAATVAADEIEADFISAYNSEDGPGIAALFASDGMIAPPGMMSIEQSGIAEYYIKQFASGGDFTLEVEREGILVAGDMSVAWGGFAASVLMEGMEPTVTTGRYGVISRREADGTWKIYRHMFNYITPPPEM